MLKAAANGMRLLASRAEQAENQVDVANKTIKQLQQQLSIKEAASKDKVTLEAVTSTQLDPDKVNRFVDLLDERGFLHNRSRQKVAAAFMENPNTAIDLATLAIKQSELPASSGFGVKGDAVNLSDSNYIEQSSKSLYEDYIHRSTFN